MFGVDSQELRQLLDGGETFTVEFKSDHGDNPISDAEVVETVACLANGDGGFLLIGVSDDGTPHGAQPRHGPQTHPIRIQALIGSRTEPSVEVAVELVEVDEAEVLVIVVTAPDSVVGTQSGRYLRRAIDVHGRPQCLPMRPHEVVSRAGSVGAQDYSKVVVPGLALDDLSEVEFARMRELARTGDDTLVLLSREEMLKALGFMTADGRVCVGGLLLFGAEGLIAQRLPAYEAGFQELDGLEVRSSETAAFPLLRAMSEFSDRVLARNPEDEIDVELQRIALPAFASTTVRELIANALVHRDYTAKGPTLVEVAADALTISNPGGLPAGVTTATLLTAPPHPRNPALADAFKRAGLVDRTSRGINRVFEGQLTLGRPAPDYSRSTPNSVVVRVHSGSLDKELARFVAEARRRGEALSLDDLLVLYEIRADGSVTVERAAELGHVGHAEARTVLNRLADREIVEPQGSGRGRRYVFTPALSRRFGLPPRQGTTGLPSSAEHRERVLHFVQQHGSISRGDAVELFEITPDQASRLMRAMRDKGLLDMVGQRRGTRYVLPSHFGGNPGSQRRRC